jgi:UDP-N-acetylglucosamine--N-acetylmuramyl-(pentapeptide) pyrophosphoryl-undecaprenol N-acetylglucosamine transferase
MIAGGGTGGHVIPALAIARELRDHHGADVRFIGTARGLETKLVPAAGFALELVRSGQLKNVSVATRLRTLLDVPLGVLHCIRMFRDFRPQVVVGVGGYASGPGMMAALLLRITTLVFEPNAVPGLTNRMVGKWVNASAVNFRETAQYLRNAVVTGIPVRQEFFGLGPRMGKEKRLLVFGGSQGARVLNEIMPQIVRHLLERFADLTIVHQVGGRHLEAAKLAYANAGLPGEFAERLRIAPYLDDMVAEFAAANLVVSRSGASTVAELAAAGKASVLVPFAAASDDHQLRNAEAFAEAGAAELIEEKALSAAGLQNVLEALLGDHARLQAMGERATTLAHRNAVQEIASMIVRLARR